MGDVLIPDAAAALVKHSGRIEIRCRLPIHIFFLCLYSLSPERFTPRSHAARRLKTTTSVEKHGTRFTFRNRSSYMTGGTSYAKSCIWRSDFVVARGQRGRCTSHRAGRRQFRAG